MSISYHGVIGHTAKQTLPSVQAWGPKTNHLLKDPPKGIHTRRKDRVGDTDDIAKIIDGSGDRACEYIRQYPLGVNPMVGVSYDNYGLNGGAFGNPTHSSASSQQAKLPYRIQDFRPPVLGPRDTLPLSRLPRNVTSFGTNPQEIDFAKKLECPRDDYRQIIKDPIHSTSRPTAYIQYEKPIEEPFEVRYIIQNPININGESGMRSMDLTTQEVLTPVKNIKDRDYYGMGTQVAYEGDFNLNFEDDDNREVRYAKYIQEYPYSAAGANPSINMSHNAAELGEFNSDRYIQDKIDIEYTTPIYGGEEDAHFAGEMILENKMPSYSMSTNLGEKIDINTKPEYIRELERKMPNTDAYTNMGGMGETNVGNRDYNNLPKRPNFGSFDNGGYIPTNRRTEQTPNLQSQKADMSKKVLDQMLGRSSVHGAMMTDGYYR